MLFRYPGGKTKVANIIIGKIQEIYTNNKCNRYIEPFFGSGAIGLKLAQQGIVDKVWFNDIDKGIASVWNAVYFAPEAFIAAIEQYSPCVDDFFEFKAQLLNYEYLKSAPMLEIALKKVATHQMSFSGLGTMAGSPIGGKCQLDEEGNPKKYQVDCRWSVGNLVKYIRLINRIYSGLECEYSGCSCYNYKDIFNWYDGIDDNSFYYLDPPYYSMGQQLYQCAFDDKEHLKLSQILQGKNNWILSYDNHPAIRELYDWAKIEEISINYTVTNKGKCGELLIMP